MPRCRPTCPSAAVRATSTAIRLAIDVPVTKIPLAPLGKTEHLARPFDDLMFDLDRNMIAPTEIGVQSGRQHLGQHADGVPPPCTHPMKPG